VHVTVDETGHHTEPTCVQNPRIIGSAESATDLNHATADREHIVPLKPAGDRTVENVTAAEH
jgi:hypothetical protein